MAPGIVENAEVILATPGVDGCWVGPSDMALSMGIPPKNRFDNERHARALEQVITACRNTGKIPGTSASGLADAVFRAKQGYQFIVASSDGEFLGDGITAAWKVLRE